MIDISVSGTKSRARAARAAKPDGRQTRSQVDRAAEAAAKEARRAEREAARLAREEREAVVRQEQAKIVYEQRMAREQTREGQRKIQEAGVEWLMGYDTPAAKLFGKWVESNEDAVTAANRRALAAGDPLNIYGHTPRPSKKQQRRMEEARREARGAKTEFIPDPDHPRQDVGVESLPHALRRKKYIDVHHQPGVEAFWRDFEVLSGASGASGFSDKVDKSSIPNVTPRTLPAAQRIEECQRTLGKLNWTLACSYLLQDIGPAEIHRRGGSQHVVASALITAALDALCDFYDRSFLSRNPNLRILREAVDNGIAAILSGERDLNWPGHAVKKKTVPV